VANAAWKEFERRIASELQGRRIPVSESLCRETDKGDVEHPIFWIECKRRRELKLTSWWKTTEEKAKRYRKIPLLCVSSQKLKRPIVMLRLHDFVNLYRRSEWYQNTKV